MAAYLQSAPTRGGPKKVPGYPGWECSNGDRLGSCSRGGYAPGAPMIDFSFLKAPGERRPGAFAGLDHRVEPTADRSCGSVVVQRSSSYELSVVKGSPPCSTVRRIARNYGHPTSKKPRFYCARKIYGCEYSTYQYGWRCGGLFQGTFQCWHGADSPARASEAFDASEKSPAQRLLRKTRDAIEFYAEQPHARSKAQCAIYDGYAGLAEAFCTTYPPREGKATVHADGSVELCRAHRGNGEYLLGR